MGTDVAAVIVGSFGGWSGSGARVLDEAEHVTVGVGHEGGETADQNDTEPVIPSPL